tara:strand:- start:79 stop:951 length:873 start_codon:yes stop_codon:yes gene_type:complete
MLGLGSSLMSSGAVSDPRALIASYDFSLLGGDMDAPGNYTGSELPTDWATSTDSQNFLMYGSTTTNVNETLQSGSPTRGWVVGYDTTASTATGPIGGHIGGPDTLTTVVTDGTAIDGGGVNNSYLVYEASSPASNAVIERRQIVRTGALDFSGYTSIELTFWFHAYGAALGNNLGAGVAVTTSATSASSAAEAGSGLGFTSDTAGGATLNYTALDGSSVSTVRLGHAGQTHTSGDSDTQADANDWIKATADLSAAAGQSSVYIHFGMIARGVTQPFTQDIAIDSIAIIGQ